MYKFLIWPSLGAFSGGCIHVLTVKFINNKYFNGSLLMKEHVNYFFNTGFFIGGAFGFMRALWNEPILPYISNHVLSKK